MEPSTGVNRRIAITAMLLMVPFGAGCESGVPIPRYVEPTLPPERAASLKPAPGSVIVERIDGARPARFAYRALLLTPGEHELAVHWGGTDLRVSYEGNATFRYTFVAGQRYRLEVYGSSFDLSLLNETTMQRAVFKSTPHAAD